MLLISEWRLKLRHESCRENAALTTTSVFELAIIESNRWVEFNVTSTLIRQAGNVVIDTLVEQEVCQTTRETPRIEFWSWGQEFLQILHPLL